MNSLTIFSNQFSSSLEAHGKQKGKIILRYRKGKYQVCISPKSAIGGPPYPSNRFGLRGSLQFSLSFFAFQNGKISGLCW